MVFLRLNIFPFCLFREYGEQIVLCRLFSCINDNMFPIQNDKYPPYLMSPERAGNPFSLPLSFSALFPFLLPRIGLHQ